jgi:hypothetical protein
MLFLGHHRPGVADVIHHARNPDRWTVSRRGETPEVILRTTRQRSGRSFFNQN